MKKLVSVFLVFFVCLIYVPSINAQIYPTLTVDYSQKTGALMYGASGFLYGLGTENSPNINLLIPLKPHTAVQKAPDGLQHPTGDVLDTTKTFIYSGGKYVQVYLQDIYALWPYEFTSFDDYLNKVSEEVQKIKALRESDPNFSGKIVYIPFNEPDSIWYNNINSNSQVQQNFFQNWLTICNLIKSLDPDALIGGMNLAVYLENTYDNFLNFCVQNNCLPDVITWHDLQTNCLNTFPSQLAHYRNLEKKYNIPEKEIVINEYAPQDHVNVPGKLVNWIALFEENKVAACLAYWHNAGSLNDLVADNNMPNGTWWLYKWYGDMSGETLKVTTSTARTELYGLASLDDNKKISHVLFGGINGTSNIVLKNLDTSETFKDAKAVKVVIERTPWTAFHGPSLDPEVIQTGTYKVIGGEVSIILDGMDDYSAYRITVTKANEDADFKVYKGRWQQSYEVENAKLIGRANKTSDPWTYAKSGGYRVNMMDSQNDGFDMKISVPFTGLYKMDIIYGNGYGVNSSNTAQNNPQTVKHTLSVDGSDPQILVLQNTLLWQMEGLYSDYIFLTEGDHTLSFRGALDTPQGATMDVVRFTYVGQDQPVFDKIYEAEFSDFNMLNGKTTTPVFIESEIENYSSFGYITGLDKGSVPGGNGARFTVAVDKGGLYNVILRYSSQQEGAVNLYLDNDAINLNNKIATLPIKNTGGKWDNTVKTIYLQEGINIIDIDATAPCAVDYLRVKKVNDEDTKTIIEAESQELSGNARITANPYASGGSYVSNIQGGTNDALTLKVNVDKAGLYKLEIYHSNGELFGAHSYNPQITDRYASFKVNEDDPVRLYFKNTYSNENFRPKTIPVYLNAGENEIKIYNDNYKILRCGTGSAGNITYQTLVNYAPNFDKFIIYPASLDEVTPSDETFQVNLFSTEGGKAFIDNYFAKAGEYVNLILTPDYTDSTIKVLANNTDITGLMEKSAGGYQLTYQVNEDTTFHVSFTNPENMDKYIKNSSFGLGDLTYYDIEGEVTIESSEDNRLYTTYYAHLQSGAKINQKITGIEDGTYSFYVYAKGSGNITLTDGINSKTYQVSERYERYELRFTVNNSTTQIGVLADGEIYLDDLSLTNDNIDSGILYFVDCGDSNPKTLSKGDKFGIYNSVTEQFYGEDPVTGKYWGLVDDYTPNANYPTLLTGRLTWPYEYDTTDGRDKVVSYRYSRDQDYMYPQPGITYKFELPNGEYTVESAYYLPSSWMSGVNRRCKITLNGVVYINSFLPTTNPESPMVFNHSVNVTDGFLTYNVTVDADGIGGSAVSYIIIRKKDTKERMYFPIDLTNKVVTGTPSWNNVASTAAQYAFDNNTSTFFDGLVGGYCQVDLGQITDISQIGYSPRPSYESRMVGGMFLGSKDGENWVKLYVIPTAPGPYIETKVTAGQFLTRDTFYRYIRYTNLVDNANIAEIKIYKNADVMFSVINLNPESVNISKAYIENNKAYITHSSQGEVTFVIAKYKDNKLESIITKKADSSDMEIELSGGFDRNCTYKLFVWDLKNLFPYTKLAS